GARARTIQDLAKDAAFLAHLDAGVKGVNAGLAPSETIKRFKVLTAEFSIEGGELTPTMKLKRKVVNQRYQAEIESLYAEPDAAPRPCSARSSSAAAPAGCSPTAGFRASRSRRTSSTVPSRRTGNSLRCSSRSSSGRTSLRRATAYRARGSSRSSRCASWSR